MYRDDDDSSDSFTENTKPLRKSRRAGCRKRKRCSRQQVQVKSEYNIIPPVKRPKIEHPAHHNTSETIYPAQLTCPQSSSHQLSQGVQSSNKENKKQEYLHPNFCQVPTKVTAATPKAKLPRSLACILDMQNINYDTNRGPTRKTKVSQEVWASSLEIKQKEPNNYPNEREMVNQEPTASKCYNSYLSPKKVCVDTKVPKTAPISEVHRKAKKKSNGSVPTAKTSRTKEKAVECGPTPKISIRIKLPVKRNRIENSTEKLQAAVQLAEDARPQVKQEQVEEASKKRLPAQVGFSGNINSLYREAYLVTRLDEDYLEKAWVESDRECPWFCGKGSSDVIYAVDFPDFDSASTVLGVQLDALDKLSGFI